MANIPSPPYIIYNVENIVLTLLSKPNRNMFYSQVAIVHLLDKKTVWGTTRKTEFLKKYLYNTIKSKDFDMNNGHEPISLVHHSPY